MKTDYGGFATFAVAFTLALALFTFTQDDPLASDYWISGADASVVTNNDCGYISAMHGQPVIVRSFHDANAPGIRANITDRISSGDEIRVPSGGRLEVTSGANVVTVLGGGCRAKFLGLRNFSTPAARDVTRVDIELLTGELRVQVRMNEVRPELAMITSTGGEIMVQRGDIAVANSGALQASILAGEAQVRLRISGTVGAPFGLVEGNVLGVGGRLAMEKDGAEKIRARAPFSFELRRAALPPQPSLSYDMEAP